MSSIRPEGDLRTVVRMGFALLLLAAFVAGCAQTADPGDVIRSYVEAYNADDIDAVMDLFTEDSVMYGHPFADELRGLAEIRAVQVDDRNAAAEIDPYVISNVSVSGDTVTWDHVWTNRDGDQFTACGQEATVADGRIVSWTWPTDDSQCG